MRGRDFGLVQEGMALVLRAPANATAGIALDLVVVFEPGQEGELSTPSARLAWIGVASAIRPCQSSTRLRVMAAGMSLPNAGKMCASISLTIAGGGSWPARQPDGLAPGLDQICDPLPAFGHNVLTAVDPHPQLDACARALPVVHAGNWPMVTRRCR